MIITHRHLYNHCGFFFTGAVELGLEVDPSASSSKAPEETEMDKTYETYADDNLLDPSYYDDPIQQEEHCDTSGDELLYEGARLTVAASMLLVVTFAIRFKLSGECLQNLLCLLEMHCLLPNKFKGTLKLFSDYFAKVRAPIEYHYFCNFCTAYYGTDKPAACNICNKEDILYFLVVPLANQLQSMFQKDGFAD